MAKNGLEEFKEVLTDFKGVTSLITKGAIGAPFVDIVLRQFDTSFSPPWPTGILVLTSVAEFLAMIFVFNYFFKASKRTLDRLMAAFLAILCLTFIFYSVLHSEFTQQQPRTKQFIVMGYEPINDDVRQATLSGYTGHQLLEENEYDADRVWTRRSITTVRIGILITWLLVFISFSIFVGAFVMAQRRPFLKNS